jgi:hypothetical protein
VSRLFVLRVTDAMMVVFNFVRTIHDELSYWRQVGFLKPSTAMSVAELLRLQNESVELTSTYTDALHDIISSELLLPLQKLCELYQQGKQDLDESRQLANVMNSPYDPILFSVEQGLLATITEDCLQFSSHRGTDVDEDRFAHTPLPRLLEHVESSFLSQMAKTGLNILSKGLGRFVL